MMKKIIIILICFLLTSCTYSINNIDIEAINNFDYTCNENFDIDINSKEYMLIDLSELKVLNAKDNDKKIYPASLTKIVTLDTVLHLCDDLSDVSNISYDQIIDLIQEDASLAGLKPDVDYTIEELLYALILPSGADAAIALENYFINKDINLIEQMNSLCQELNCKSSNFVNTTGLHDEEHYTSLDDLFIILMDTLSYKEGRIILETLKYELSDDTKLLSTLIPIVNNKTIVLGGKTGYTPESGQSLITLFRHNNRSYILMIANAEKINYKDTLHYDDAIEIFNELY